MLFKHCINAVLTVGRLVRRISDEIVGVAGENLQRVSFTVDDDRFQRGSGTIVRLIGIAEEDDGLFIRLPDSGSDLLIEGLQDFRIKRAAPSEDFASIRRRFKASAQLPVRRSWRIRNSLTRR